MKFNPCPVCGNEPYTGWVSALTVGVQCETCGITISRTIPNRVRLSRVNNYDLRILFKVWRIWQALTGGQRD